MVANVTTSPVLPVCFKMNWEKSHLIRSLKSLCQRAKPKVCTCLSIRSSMSHCICFPGIQFVLLMCAVYDIMVWNKSVMSVFIRGPEWSCRLISTCCDVSHTSSISCSTCQRFYWDIRVNLQIWRGEMFAGCNGIHKTNKHAFWGQWFGKSHSHYMKFCIIKPLPTKCMFVYSNVYQLFTYLALADC